MKSPTFFFTVLFGLAAANTAPAQSAPVIAVDKTKDLFTANPQPASASNCHLNRNSN